MGDSICKDYICSCAACTGRAPPTLAEACEVIRGLLALLDREHSTSDKDLTTALDFLERVGGKC